MTGTLDWTLAAIAAATSGVLDGDPAMHIHAVSADSRTVGAGSLFVAIRGEHHDGHDFTAAAIEGGAVACMVERGAQPNLLPRIEVDDTTQALIDLAAHRRAELTMPVAAITGSSGKTSTKDLLAAALPASWSSPRSYNNEIGVPLTVLGAPGDADWLVLEVGSRGAGHITRLAPAVLPDVAVITNLGLVHLETFGTRDALADGKFELIESLGSGGVAVLPDNEPRLARPHPGPTVTFGTTPDADVGITDLTLDDEGRPRFVLNTGGSTAPVALAMTGAHHALNAAAAAAAALTLGRDLDEVAAGLGEAKGSPWRMEVHRGRFTVVNDAYNANPDSVLAALETVAAMSSASSPSGSEVSAGSGQRIAVLGEMAELGDVADEEHVKVGRAAFDLGFAVITVGDDHGLAEAAGGRNVADQAMAAQIVADEAGDAAVVLVKASRASGFERLAARLVEESQS
jgi:UDP-N-acetylmuramoyl-tripeptide--D-alanyl-D-alanine ligase